MPIKAAIFDMDGLLINSERIALAIFLELGQEYKLSNMHELYMACLGTNDVETRRLVSNAISGRTDPNQFLSAFTDRYRTATTRQPVPLMQGVESLLDNLDTRGIKTAVATSTDTALALHKLENSNVLHRFSFVIGGDQIKNGKPAPDIYLHAADKLDVDPADCLGLEDSPNGVRAAVAAGLTTIQIPDIVEPTAELQRLGHIVLGSLHEVVEWLDNR